MHPIFWTLVFSPSTARLAAVIATVLLGAFIIWDGLRTDGKGRLGVLLLQAGLFTGIGVAAALAFLTPERLPETVQIDLRSWGLFTVLSLLLGFAVQRRFGRRAGLSSEQILSIWVYGGIFLLIGARGLHVALNWGDYAAQPLAAIAFWDGGLALLGGILPAILFVILFLGRQGLGLAALDAIILGVALSQGVGRIGCFLAGCCYGQVTDSWLGVSFPLGSIAQFTLAHQGHIDWAESTPPLHPTQLYEAAAAFAVGLMLLFVHRRGTARPGAVTCGYLLAYPAARFLLEILRYDPEREFLFRWPAEAPLILSTAQTTAVLLMPLAAWGLWRIQTGRGLPLLAAPAPEEARG